MTISSPPSEVEEKLREYVRKLSSRPSPELTYWPGSAAVDRPEVEALDAVGECQTIALAAARGFGLGMCGGVVASEAHPERPVIHFWNRDLGTGELIDAARSRRTARGYLGAELHPAEVAELSFAIEREDRLRETSGKIVRALDVLLGGRSS